MKTIKQLKAEYTDIERRLHDLDQDFRGLHVPFSYGTKSRQYKESEKIADMLWEVSLKIRNTFLPPLSYKDKKTDVVRKVEESWELLDKIQTHAFEVLDQTYLLMAYGKKDNDNA